VTAGVVERVLALRDERGWSMQQLADRCAEAGMPSLKRSVLVNLQVGRRPYVTLSELMVLAQVFAVEPAALLAPRDRTVFCGKYAVDREAHLIDMIGRDFRELLYRVRDVLAVVREGKTPEQEFLEYLDGRIEMLGEHVEDLNQRLAKTPHVRVVGGSWSTDEQGRRL
jgi:transcriptional regulator with XRE-family HTH domain